MLKFALQNTTTYWGYEYMVYIVTGTDLGWQTSSWLSSYFCMTHKIGCYILNGWNLSDYIKHEQHSKLYLFSLVKEMCTSFKVKKVFPKDISDVHRTIVYQKPEWIYCFGCNYPNNLIHDELNWGELRLSHTITIFSINIFPFKMDITIWHFSFYTLSYSKE